MKQTFSYHKQFKIMYTSQAKLIRKDDQVYSLRVFFNGLTTVFNRTRQTINVLKNVGGKDIIILKNIKLTTHEEYDEFIYQVEQSKI